MIETEKKKPRYSWWPDVRNIIQAYPYRKYQELSGEALQEQKAVQAAIGVTERMWNGEARLDVIRMVHWKKTNTLEGAALRIPCSERTAANWQRQFFEEVARNINLLK